VTVTGLLLTSFHVSFFCSNYKLVAKISSSVKLEKERFKISSNGVLSRNSYCSTLEVSVPGGAGSYLRSGRFSGFYDRPSKEICQSFENGNEHALNAKITRGNRNMFRRHFCPGFAFDSITFYLPLAIFNDSSETIRTKGMKDQLCAIFLASVVAFLVAWPGEV